MKCFYDKNFTLQKYCSPECRELYKEQRKKVAIETKLEAQNENILRLEKIKIEREMAQKEKESIAAQKEQKQRELQERLEKMNQKNNNKKKRK